MDGKFGEGELQHLSRWQAVKVVSESEEEDERGVVTIRQRESFSHCLNLLYIDGEVAVLTADAPSPSEEPPTRESAPTRARLPVEPPEGAGRKFRLEEVIGEERP